MVAKVGDEDAIRDDEVKSLAPAFSGIARRLAGRSRMLTELSSGVSGVLGEDPSTAKNPQQLVGIDLSGPPFGSALRHPIAHWSGNKVESNIRQPTQPLTVLNVSSIAIPRPMRWRFWNRPFCDLGAGGNAPYSRGLVALRAHNSTAATPTLTTRVRSITKGQTFAAGKSTTTVISGGVTETGFDLGTGFFVELAPGWNMIELLFTHASTGLTVTIDSVCLYQFAKRSH